MNFCSHCGSNELEQSIPPGDNRLRTVCRVCQTVHYENPKIIAGCLPVWEGKLLLCRRAIEPRKGLWNVPAGFMERGESVEEGAIREVWEEAEAVVRNLKLHNIFTFKRFHHVYVQFVGELVDGKFGVGMESTETRLFTEAEIPWSDIAFESSLFALRNYIADRANGNNKVHIGYI